MKFRSIATVVASIVVAAFLASAVVTAFAGQAQESAEVPTDDPIAVLERRIAAGEVTLTADAEQGYLRSLLEALDIPLSSQGLVFSRTSLQTDRITPWSPRAIYFNDDVYIGWVPTTTFIEIASIDPDEGAVFYTLPQEDDGQPQFQRQTTTCLMCHESRAVTGGVPGVIMMSVLTDRMGYVISPVHEGSSTDRTPLDKKFGGWYVTGTHGEALHSGNTKSPMMSHEVSDAPGYVSEFDRTADGNVRDLDGRFDTSPYLSTHSDLVALLVLSHQARVHNMIIMARRLAADALRDQDARIRSGRAELPASGLLSATESRIDDAVERLLRETLFAGAAPLDGPLKGTTGFAEEFAALGPMDSKGRSLRDLDLNSRLFRYPLSFLIYSDAFDVLPDVVTDRYYARLNAVLLGEDETETFAHLLPEDRAAILEILLDTKPEFTAKRSG